MKQKLVGALAALTALSSVVCDDSPDFPEVVDSYDTPEEYLRSEFDEVQDAIEEGILYSVEYAPTLDEMSHRLDLVYGDIPEQDLVEIRESLRSNSIITGTNAQPGMTTVPNVRMMGKPYRQIIVVSEGLFDLWYMTSKGIELFLEHELQHVRDNYFGLTLPSGRTLDSIDGLTLPFAVNLYEVRAFHDHLKESFNAFNDGEVTQDYLHNVASSYIVTRSLAEQCISSLYERSIWNNQLSSLSEISIHPEGDLYRLSIPDQYDIVLEIPPGSPYAIPCN